jgi:hypothetical protein
MLGLEWLKHFDKHTKARQVGSYRLLILDGHESHLNQEFKDYCLEHKILTLCMPPHSSHILQPLDVVLLTAETQVLPTRQRLGTPTSLPYQ